MRPMLGERPAYSILELFDRDMRISLRGLQRGMAEHLLHLAQIRTPVEHMGGGGMAQRMRRDVRHPRLLGLLMHHLTHHTLVDAAPTYTNEHRVAAVPIREYRPSPCSQCSTACCAGAPNGMTRVLFPLPSTRTVRFDQSNEPMSNPTSSPTRIPVAYSNSSIAQSRSAFA